MFLTSLCLFFAEADETQKARGKFQVPQLKGRNSGEKNRNDVS